MDDKTNSKSTDAMHRASTLAPDSTDAMHRVSINQGKRINQLKDSAIGFLLGVVITMFLGLLFSLFNIIPA